MIYCTTTIQIHQKSFSKLWNKPKTEQTLNLCGEDFVKKNFAVLVEAKRQIQLITGIMRLWSPSTEALKHKSWTSKKITDYLTETVWMLNLVNIESTTEKQRKLS